MHFSVLEEKKKKTTLANMYSTWNDKIIFKKSCLTTVSYIEDLIMCNSQ